MLIGGRHQAITAVLARAAIALAAVTFASAGYGPPAFAATDNHAGGIGSWPWPLIGEVVGEYRNGSDPYAAGQHRGVDIAAPAGTPARAVVAGTVSFSGKLPDGGQTVTIRSADHLVSYLHLSRRDISRGASVGVGEVVGLTGTTGKRSTTQPHLHIGVRLAATRRYVDPMTLLGPKRMADPVRSTPSPASPDSKSKPATQRSGGERSVRIEPLESAAGGQESGAETIARPNATADSKRLDTTAAERPNRRPAKTAASIEAPPPLKSFEASRAQPAEPRVRHSPAPPRETAAAETTSGSTISPRLLLLTLTALALVALFANRHTRVDDQSLPAGPVAMGNKQEQQVAEDDRPLLQSVK